jgi:hypothetical protein
VQNFAVAITANVRSNLARHAFVLTERWKNLTELTLTATADKTDSRFNS